MEEENEDLYPLGYKKDVNDDNNTRSGINFMKITTSTAEVFKLSNNTCLVNIYLEETAANQGRVIVSLPGKVYQRYFDGAGGGLKSFLSNMDVETFVNALESRKIQKSHKKCIKIIDTLKPFWNEFREVLKKHLNK